MSKKNLSAPDLASLLLEWYKIHGRDLPWRVKGKAHPDPYAVWVSEIMLQQTTVKTVTAYFERWMERFPDLKTLAEAAPDELLLFWQGLGYYSRARKMHQCAKVLIEQYKGIFPADRESLLRLPGIGPYTASSLCAFAFDLPETVIDGNVCRVLARFYGIEGEIDRQRIAPFAEALTPPDRGADHASAIMDLGATVCTPAAPECPQCPWQKHCTAYSKGLTEKIPLMKKTAKKKKEGKVFILYSPEGELFIRKRSEKGLLSGLWELPWDGEGEFPFEADWRKISCRVRHIFTHIDLSLDFFTTKDTLPENFTDQGVFVPKEKLSQYPFSTLMKKVLKELSFDL